MEDSLPSCAHNVKPQDTTMADPLLTSLCAICHVSEPKYKCPRCAIRTCSLPCIKKHKAWSECSGERDPTTYIPRSKLRTPAGIDHDYNFLYGMERSMERGEKIIVEEKGLVQQEELRPLTVQEVRWKPGRDGRKRKVLVTRVLREAKGRSFERFLMQRLRKLNIKIVCVPQGMSRQKENNTTLNRKSGRINWQVEWLKLENTTEETVDGKPKPQRVLSKVMDDIPLYQAYHAMLEERSRKENPKAPKIPRGVRGGDLQDPLNSTWGYATASVQDPFGGTWVSYQSSAIEEWPYQVDEASRQRYQFFLARLPTRADKPAIVTSLKSTDCLRDVLANTNVLEFPSIYVLNGTDTLPRGLTLGPKDMIETQGTKRRTPPGQKNPKRAKKQRREGKDALEEGEVESDEDGRDDNLPEDEDDSGSKGAVGLEAGEVIAEQSLGEDDDGEDEDDDDSTSSSGTDSE